jgi:hypothetical protein
MKILRQGPYIMQSPTPKHHGTARSMRGGQA